MNTSPRRNVVATRIACMGMEVLKDEKVKVIKVVTSGEIEMLDELTPRVEASSVGTYTISEKDCRNLPNGRMNAKIHSRSDIKYQLAKMEEARNASLEDYEK